MGLASAFYVVDANTLNLIKLKSLSTMETKFLFVNLINAVLSLDSRTDNCTISKRVVSERNVEICVQQGDGGWEAFSRDVTSIHGRLLTR